MTNAPRSFTGPAFPLPNGTTTVAGTEGMSLRDYFAAKAMQGMLCEGFMPNMIKPEGSVLQAYNYADAAYRMADAMMEARK